MTIEIKFEHDKVKAWSRTPLGLVVELSAPEMAPAIETAKRPNKSVVFVIDNSGSMDGGRLEIVKRAILEQLPKFRAGDSLGIVTFSAEARVVMPLTQFNENELQEYRYMVQGIQAAGNTNLEDGYRLGISQAQQRGDNSGEATIILLSDGEANAGETHPTELGRFASFAFERGITTSTIGIGDGYDERILVALAENGRGSHVAAYRDEQAANAIRAEIEDLNARTMLDTQIEVEVLAPFDREDARIRCHTKLREYDRKRCVALGKVGDLPAGHNQNVAFELRLSAALNRTNQHIAAVRVKVSYTDGNTNNRVVVERIQHVHVVAEHDWVEPRRNPDVVAELADLRLQNDKERIYELLQQGRAKEARALLKRLNLDLDAIRQMGLTPRNFDRMSMQYNSMSTSESLSDLELAKYMMASKLEREQDRKKRN